MKMEEEEEEEEEEKDEWVNLAAHVGSKQSWTD